MVIIDLSFYQIILIIFNSISYIYITLKTWYSSFIGINFNIFIGNLITSRGPATAFDFSLAIVETLLNKEKAQSVADGLLYENYKSYT